MCLGCVADGELTLVTYNKIGQFCERWESAEFGPAHIVLGDDNVNDHCLNHCLENIATTQARRLRWLNQEELSLLPDHERDWYAHHADDELEATAAFLRELLAIPEDLR